MVQGEALVSSAKMLPNLIRYLEAEAVLASCRPLHQHGTIDEGRDTGASTSEASAAPFWLFLGYHRE